ncbi:MAG: hypothetical protein MJY90_02220 [Bacteroidaceae bacterium]|nr:hypothetical protein [Bacteroidaceae bacterium]
MRRIAAHTMTISGETFRLHVAELTDDGTLIRHYPLTHELPQTEWHHTFLIP